MADTLLFKAASLQDLYLHRMRFQDDREAGESVAEDDVLQAEFFLGCLLFADGSVGVEFGGTFFTPTRKLEAEVSYRMIFTQGKDAAAGVDPQADEQFAREVSARLAPLIAIPYVRETLGSMTGKSRGSVILPLINAGELFDPEEVQIWREERKTPTRHSRRVAKPKK